MTDNRRWRRQMMKAITEAATDFGYVKPCSRTDGLRAIRDFERINGIRFDPFDEAHLMIVSGMGRFAGLHHRLRKLGVA